MKHMKLPTSKRPIRYVCTGCGAWHDGDANRLIVAGITGYEPDDPHAPLIASAKEAEMPFMARHGRTCRANISIIYPGSPEWAELDADKRED